MCSVYQKTVYSLLIVVVSLLFYSCEESLEREPISLLTLGDSYTIGENVDSVDGWPQQLSRRLIMDQFEVDLQVLARTGWTTAGLQNAIEDSPNLDEVNFVGLMIGVNDQFSAFSLFDFAERYTQLLDTVIYMAGSKERVFVMSIPDYAYTPYGQGISPEFISAGVGAFNRTAKELTDSIGVKWYNITPISQEGVMRPELVSDDELHPSALQYKEWVDFIYPGLLVQLQ